MTVSKERKAELTAQFGDTPVDTGNPKVQVAILSERIKELTEHMKSHQKDFHSGHPRQHPVGFVHAKSVLRSGALFLCKGVNNHALKRGGGRGPASHEKPAGKGPVG